MSAVINTNMAAIRTHGIYNRNNIQMNDAMTRVATAQKVNSVRDNASDWAISEKMRERIRSLSQANQNVQNDTAMVKTASGALGNTIDILKTLKERAVNAANDSNQDTDRQKIQTEITQLLTQIDENAKIKFNGKGLLDGTAAEEVKNDTASVLTAETASDADLDSLGFGSGITEGTLTWTDANGSHTATSGAMAKTKVLTDVLSAVKENGSTISSITFSYKAANTATGATDKNNAAVNTTESSLVAVSNTAGTAGAISGMTLTLTDGTTTKAYKFSELQEAMDANSDDNPSPLTFQFGDDASLNLDFSISKMDKTGLGIGSINVSTKSGAQSAMTTIDDALTKALKEQTKLGSMESRLGYTSDNLSTQIENLEASDSAIRDADMAKEMTSYMKWSVLAQASQYMLAQAGQNAFSVLNLLQA